MCKRRRYDDPSTLRQLPWQEPDEVQTDKFGHHLEVPAYTLRELRGGRDEDDIDDDDPCPDPSVGSQVLPAGEGHRLHHPLGAFGRLPMEIRERIFRELLVQPGGGDIRVLHGWSLVYPRGRPQLATAVLAVCRAFHREGARVLYGANTFAYLLRDPAAGGGGGGNKTSEARRPGATTAVIRHVYGREALPLARHGRHLRHVRVAVEANRMYLWDSRRLLPAALELLLPDRGVARPERLVSVTLELPAQTREQLNMMGDRDARLSGDRRLDVPAASWFRPESPVLQALEQLNCQFLHIIARDSRGECYRTVIDRRPYFSETLENGGSQYDLWKDDQLMLEARRKAARQSQARLHTMEYWIRQLATDPEAAILQGPFQYSVPSEACSADLLEALPSGSSTRSSGLSARSAPQNYGIHNFLPDLGDDVELEFLDNDDADSTYSGLTVDESDDTSLFVRGRRPKRNPRRNRRPAD